MTTSGVTADAGKETKPGVKTTEFQATATLVVGSVIQMLANPVNIPDKTAFWGAVASIGAYAISRGFAKLGVKPS